MPLQPDLESLERKAWRSFHQDGLWDVFVGLVLIASGVSALVGSRWVTFLLLIVAVMPSLVGKRFVTVPRMGLVEFPSARRVWNRRVAAVLFLGVLLVAALYAVAVANAGVLGWRPERDTAMTLAMSLLILVVFGGIAYWLDFPRMLALGLAFAGAFAGARLWDTPIILLIAGAVVLCWGVALLLRFLGTYPLPGPGGDHEAR
jgi:hypothetical protein